MRNNWLCPKARTPKQLLTSAASQVEHSGSMSGTWREDALRTRPSPGATGFCACLHTNINTLPSSFSLSNVYNTPEHVHANISVQRWTETYPKYARYNLISNIGQNEQRGTLLYRITIITRIQRMQPTKINSF